MTLAPHAAYLQAPALADRWTDIFRRDTLVHLGLMGSIVAGTFQGYLKDRVPGFLPYALAELLFVAAFIAWFGTLVVRHLPIRGPGIVPGVVMTVLMMLTVAVFAYRRGWGSDTPFEIKRLLSASLEVVVVLSVPVLIYLLMSAGLSMNVAVGLALLALLAQPLARSERELDVQLLELLLLHGTGRLGERVRAHELRLVHRAVARADLDGRVGGLRGSATGRTSGRRAGSDRPAQHTAGPRGESERCASHRPGSPAGT